MNKGQPNDHHSNEKMPIIITHLLQEIPEEQEPFHGKICYPQADDIEKIRMFVENVYLGYTTKEELIEIFGITGRQIDYYGNAARYLHLVTRIKGNFLATGLGQQLATLDKGGKRRLLIEQLFRIPSIRNVFKKILSRPLDKSLIIESMHESDVYLRTAKMENRRARTIYSWVVWTLDRLPKLYQNIAN